MKPVLSVLLIICVMQFAVASDATVTTQIRFGSAEASEVYLVWGVNDWKMPDGSALPPGSYLNNGLTYTPMSKGEEYFFLDLPSKAGTKLDYVFWITKGLRGTNTDIWDVNVPPHKDYHTLALQDNVVFVESLLPARPAEPLTILDFAWPMLITISAVMLGFFLAGKYRYRTLLKKPSPFKYILGSAGALVLALFMVRASVVLLSWDLYRQPAEFLMPLIWAGIYDLLYVDALVLVFIFLLFLSRRSTAISRGLAWAFSGIALCSLAVAVLNIRIVGILGGPFNYRWLYYSGFLKSPDAKSALMHNISGDYIFSVIVVCVSVLLAGIVLAFIAEFILARFKMKKVYVAAFILLQVVYFGIAKREIHAHAWGYERVANPVTAFLGSLPGLEQESDLFSMEVPDSVKVYKGPDKRNDTIPEAVVPGIRNVIIYVLESTPAEYVQPYSGQFNVTPELAACMEHAVVFDNIYAHAPATNKSMVSLLSSMPPWLSYNSITQEHPALALSSLGSELKKQGYRTAFFNSGDNSFQQAGEFLAHRKFDAIKDCKTIQCKQQFKPGFEKWEGLDGNEDECTARELMKWMAADTSAPFLGVMWTYQTHYPYYFNGEEEKFNTSDPSLNRYLNAVKNSDRVLGELISGLKKSGLFQSTLLVVIGDHGEAFGRHGQVTHASGIYEENVHVPCMFINPGLVAGHHSAVGGIMDIAPTVAALLHLQAPPGWYGTSLFSKAPDERVYFFSPWSDYLFGMREGTRKYIFNATKNSEELYDLRTDSLETRNLAELFPEETRRYRLHLAAWVQQSSRQMEELFLEKRK